MSPTEAPPTWRTRITRSIAVPPDQLLANPKNWRIHPQHQQDALLAVLDRVGWVARVIVQEGTDLVIDGHLRVALALRRGEPTIPVDYTDLDDEEADLILATFDPLAALAAADAAQLAALRAALPADDLDLAPLAAADLLTLPEPVEAPEAFRSYDEDLATDYCCPKCGYEWSGRAR